MTASPVMMVLPPPTNTPFWMSAVCAVNVPLPARPPEYPVLEVSSLPTLQGRVASRSMTAGEKSFSDMPIVHALLPVR